MTWREGQFFDVEEPQEMNEDPFRCTWCKKAFDASRMHDHMAPETKLMEAVARMHSEGRELDEVLHCVRLAWEREAH